MSRRYIVPYIFLTMVLSCHAFSCPPSDTSSRCTNLDQKHKRSIVTLLTARQIDVDDILSNQITPNYMRLQSRSIHGSSRKIDFQTAVVTLSKFCPETGETNVVDLHGQVHFAEKSYYDFFNDQHIFSANYDRIFYELLVPAKLLVWNKDDRSRSIVPSIDGHLSPVAPSPSDVNTAQQYNLCCQLDVVHYAQPKWFHCDYTREEFIATLDIQTSRSMHRTQPLWALASSPTQAVIPGLEFVSAFFRPLTPSMPYSAPFKRNLFSNLFLSGDALINMFRFILWFLAPSPEVSILLLDWSSLSPRPTGGFSQIVNPVLSSLFTGHLSEARKLLFAQMLVTSQGQNTHIDSKGDHLIRSRNRNAMKIFTDSMTWHNLKRSALLYGALHCEDLQRRFEEMGYRVQKVEWRTAWSVNVPEFGTGRPSSQNDAEVEMRGKKKSWGSFAFFGGRSDFAVAPLYLLIGGLDWLDTVESLLHAINAGDWSDCFLLSTTYILRHLAFYLALSKFVVDWNGEKTLFGGDEDNFL